MKRLVYNLLELTAAERSSFEAAAPEFEHAYGSADAPDAALLARAEVILGTPAPAAIAECKNLGLLQSHWSGTNEYLDVLPVGALLCGCAGAYNEPVSEHVCALLLAVCHRLGQCRDDQTARVWGTHAQLKGLHNANVLILGAGQIAGTLGPKLKGLGAGTVTGVRRNAAADHPGLDGLRPVEDVDALLGQADVVIMILPGSPATKGFMDERRLRLMKPDAVLVNVGRGNSLDLDALERVLAEGRLWGAAVDVTEPEPLNRSHPLWQRENCLITPHIAGGFRLPGTREAAHAICLENLRRYACGQRPINIAKEG